MRKIALPSSYRIFPTRHASTPLGTGPGDSRFCDRTSGFTVLYATPDFATAFIEVVVRDRFTRAKTREILLKEVTTRSYSRISSGSRKMLSLLDLRRYGCSRLGAPTDAVNARNNAAGRALCRDIHTHHGAVDGILFASRLTGEDV
ncbi:RES family NAD+ phosphorylase [Ruegeria sp. HKCCD8929]|uniref:RES family NAD+ phosphorylase n=1 Tax=Ruegeria sp. HKCCD8929 TaxID=2683006 RepID=UPI001489E4CC